MFRPTKSTGGAVQVLTSDPAFGMWGSVNDGVIELGQGSRPGADAEIRGPASVFVLAVAGRVRSADVLGSALAVDGDQGLAERFLSSWHLI